MKKTIIRKELALALTCLGLGFAACDENVHDFGKDYGSTPGNLAYIADADKQSEHNIFWNLEGERSGVDTVVVKIPVYLSEPAKSETRVTLAVDDYLREVYNAANGTSYYELASQYIGLTNPTLTIREGETKSAGTFTVAVARLMNEMTEMNGYLIPVKIRSFRGTDVGIDYTQRASYVAINVAFENTVEASGVVNATNKNLNEVELKVTSRHMIQSDASVTFSVDNSLIAAFNAERGTDFQPIASGLPATCDVPLAVGTKEATFTLNYTGEPLNDGRGYLVPLKITSTTGTNMVTPEGDENVIYVVVLSNSGSYVADQASIGTKITDTTGYSASAAYDNGSSTGATPNAIFLTGTGMTSMFMIMSPPAARTISIAIDLGKEVENITGFTLTNAMPGNGSNQSVRTMNVSYSNEVMKEANFKMDVVKMDFNTTTPVRPKVINIKFDSPITARYIYLDNVKNVSSYITLNEFRIFVQE
jgi:hypothetical protein